MHEYRIGGRFRSDEMGSRAIDLLLSTMITDETFNTIELIDLGVSSCSKVKLTINNYVLMSLREHVSHEEHFTGHYSIWLCLNLLNWSFLRTLTTLLWKRRSDSLVGTAYFYTGM
jgi:hypothetical protein